ncbi:Transcriptional regulatory protein rxt2 [Choanephora cucurbitarum]|uniref:Transcriptional regulatory protein rxt2 n=1 Tax=Choanephora cucurbitarum TaxID=101091 RepID=A0A1C7N3G2_9FUNG|nr:Transcriptional regulatory protein rxt2 [Choanephora cucurbitarum]
MSQPLSTDALPPANKWIQPDNDESDSDQKWATQELGGNKLRAPKTLAEEEEFSKFGKKRAIVKRKRKRSEDGISDEEEDPYTLINIEDILSPIELPTDIVRRPALRRILLSTQIDALAKTSMEFIENEKNFNKILCRLSSIMHQDDPRYLNLTFERTVEERQKYQQEQEAAREAALSSHISSDAVDALDPRRLDADVESSIHKERIVSEQQKKVPNEDDDEEHVEQEQVVVVVEEQEEEGDVEARDVVKRVKELLLENINYSNEYIARLQGARNKLCKASMQKETLWKELKASAREEDMRNKATYHH